MLSLHLKILTAFVKAKTAPPTRTLAIMGIEKGTAPPIAMRWATANAEPAGWGPILLWIDAAIDPNTWVDGVRQGESKNNTANLPWAQLWRIQLLLEWNRRRAGSRRRLLRQQLP